VEQIEVACGIETQKAPERFETLIKQVEAKIAPPPPPPNNMAPYSKLYSLATPCELFQFYLGQFFSAIAGAALPVTFAYLIGNAFDIFNPASDPEGFEEALYDLLIKYSIVGQPVSHRTKKVYLQKILQQDCSYFDTTNFMELPSKINTETESLKNAIGIKSG
jgi:hypothetical protein